MLKVKEKPEENGIQEVKAVHMAHRQLFAPYDRSKGNFGAVCTICGAYQRYRSCCYNVIFHKKKLVKLAPCFMDCSADDSLNS